MILVITDDADAHVTVQAGDIALKLGSELGIADVMDKTRESVLFPDSQSAAPRAEVGMIIGAVKQVADTIFF